MHSTYLAPVHKGAIDHGHPMINGTWKKSVRAVLSVGVVMSVNECGAMSRSQEA